jgi:hypothetical protein|nr:MAG TPA: Minor capsid protein from bacteriophage [Caudoviricetes sp.]
MTVSQAVINWLLTFDSEYGKMTGIDTDIIKGTTASYALVKEPVQNKIEDILGNVTCTDYYQLAARLDSQVNSDRIDNVAFLEALTEWIREKNKAKDYPVIKQGTVEKIEVTTPFYLGKTDGDNSIYQLTIAIKYKGE